MTKYTDEALRLNLGLLGAGWISVEERRKPALAAMRQAAWDQIEYVRSLEAVGCHCSEGEVGRDGEPVAHAHDDHELRIKTEEENFIQVCRAHDLLGEYQKDLEKQAKPLKAAAIRRGMPLG